MATREFDSHAALSEKIPLHSLVKDVGKTGNAVTL
jgi:hypothetical protein